MKRRTDPGPDTAGEADDAKPPVPGRGNARSQGKAGTPGQGAAPSQAGRPAHPQRAASAGRAPGRPDPCEARRPRGTLAATRNSMHPRVPARTASPPRPSCSCTAETSPTGVGIRRCGRLATMRCSPRTFPASAPAPRRTGQVWTAPRTTSPRSSPTRSPTAAPTWWACRWAASSHCACWPGIRSSWSHC